MTVPVPPPPSAYGTGRNRALALGVAGLLVVLGLGVVLALFLRSDGGGTTAGPAKPDGTATPADSPTATQDPAEPSPPPPPDDPSPGAGDDDSGDDDSGDDEAGPGAPLPGPRPDGIDEITAQVSALRALASGEPLDVRVVPAQDLGSRLSQLAFAEYDDEDIELDQRLLTTLRLLGPEEDLRSAVEDLYSAQVLGLYVIEEQVLYVAGTSATLTAAQRITAAHEVVHALQDATFDLDAFMDLDEYESDATLARLALVEGDATLTQELWSVQHQSASERQDAIAESRQHSTDPLLRAPAYVRESLMFPYTHGTRFVEALFLEGGYRAIDAAFISPPTSTRHILQPETYLAGEQHTGTSVTTTPGDGWDEAASYTFGQFDVDQWLAAVGAGRSAVTQGWDGGETRLWRRDGEDAVALALRLSDPAAAQAACDAVPSWYAAVAGGEEVADGLHRGDRDWMAVTCNGLDVVVGLAGDPGVAGQVAGR